MPVADRIGEGSPSVAARVTATVLVIGALSLLTSIALPAFLALVLAVAFSPVANWLERRGLPRSAASLACFAAVVAVLAILIGLIVYPTNLMIQQVGQTSERLSEWIDDFSKATGTGPVLESLGMVGGEAGLVAEQGQDDGSGREFWRRFLLQSGQSLGQWIVGGIGGLLGVLGGLVILLAFFFYMLNGRSEWIGRLKQAGRGLGLRFDDGDLLHVRQQVVTFVGCLASISLGYVIVITLATWAIGLPHPLFWGVLTGALQLVPYFGPTIAGVLPTLVAATLGHGWWQPLTVIAVFFGLQMFEGYVVTPLLYGKAISIDPVTILFGVLFMGWLWGPLGLITAMPMLILVRGLLSATPGTPALDALAEVDEA